MVNPTDLFVRAIPAHTEKPHKGMLSEMLSTEQQLPAAEQALWVTAQLQQLAEPDYRRFTAKLLPGIDSILGVRLPELRRLARQIAKGDWRAWLEQAGDAVFEERMLQGLVLCYAKAEPQELLNRTAAFIPKIDNWSICDSLCTGYRLAEREPELVWDFLQPYLSSPLEFPCRFGVVMLLVHYCTPQHLQRTLERLAQVQPNGYYAQMAVAWAVSVCFVKDPALTMPYLQRETWDDLTHNKALQKIAESLRVPPEQKAAVKSLKRPAAQRLR